MAHVDVLVAGAGPVGLTAALELRRQGVTCRVVDRLPARLPYARAVGVQPRTLELWDRAGVARDALDAAVPLRGQISCVDGADPVRMELALPPEVPYGFAALPQNETERILDEHLRRLGTRVERGTELVSFSQDEGGVWSRLVLPSGDGEEVRSRFLVGCDGAHSAVRKGLGLTFEGGALPEEYMLADVEVDWDMPPGYGVRVLAHGAGGAEDVLVGIPLPGRSRYRLSMAAAPELRTRPGREAGAVLHGLGGGAAPGLHHVQAVLDRLAPGPATATRLRWSSVFRISHRIVDRYGRGRVFVAGDAAHIHPPTGAQGMNTGIQDAVNLAWKLALAVSGTAHPGLLDSYDAERRPVGAEVVGRTVRHAAGGGVQSDPEDPARLLLREAQLLVGYRGSPVAGAPGESAGPRSGDRAPDCGGLAGAIASFPVRLFDLLRDTAGHVLVLYAPTTAALADFADAVAAVRRATRDGAGVRAVTDGPLPPGGTAAFPVWADAAGEFRRVYAVRAPTGFLIRPDGYLGLRFGPDGTARCEEYLARILRP
ncbi:FAD-dependent monooxygenase [Streptomyces sp. C10-9-1]|uniref:FAD-dependent monooxygenase n=1 Tax=Streptomyces sp. C10-9-1 TaxID=1859285 RepID=UPI002112F503|nr:FAD-dependent monooxygenase [Streptomyces sp. C10-9-1]MCQ6553361.1 FAD-dependent monooxygenase [Streptomyces sp. C10-9-1]